MNKYKVRVQADKLKEILPIPREFEHKEVEVMISLPRKKSFNPREYRGIFNHSKESIDKHVQQMRDEWDRHGE